MFAVGTFGLSLSQRSHKPLPDLVIAPFVVLTKVRAGVGVVHVQRVSELCLYQAFVAVVAFGRAVVSKPVFRCHHERLFGDQLGPHHLSVVHSEGSLKSCTPRLLRGTRTVRESDHRFSRLRMKNRRACGPL